MVDSTATVSRVEEFSASSAESFHLAILAAIDVVQNKIEGEVQTVHVSDHRIGFTGGAKEYHVNVRITYVPFSWKPRVM